MTAATPTAQYLCTPDEIRRITGRKRATAQRRWLDNHGWTYAVSYRGEIVIARAQLEARLNPPNHFANPGKMINAGQDGPDWSALDATP